MKTTTFFRIAIALAGVALMRGQDLRPVHFSGVISDYSPSNISGGPWEIRGEWTLDIAGAGTATFSADVTMETSDYGVTSPTQIDPTNPSTRTPHTHHISVTGATVSYDISSCPANSPATTGAGIMVSAPVTTSANGGTAPFDAKGPSTLQICITGGSEVSFSNLTIVYTGGGATHFGPQAIHGVVRKVSTQ